MLHQLLGALIRAKEQNRHGQVRIAEDASRDRCHLPFGAGAGAGADASAGAGAGQRENI